METIDNPGGIVSVEFVFTSDIKMMFTDREYAYIILNSGASWKEIPAGKNKISIEATGTQSDSGTIYDTKATILCPSNKVSYSHLAYFRQFRMYGVIVRYKLSSGELYVAGNKQIPLRGTYKRITPTKMSDFSGYQLDLSAKNTDPLLPYHS